MQIAGIQKMTLVDFPDHVAATVFTRGCSFRCGFCHNPELVIPQKFNPLLSEKEIFDFLESRYGKLTGICITGGEPCMQPDIDKFISHLKALGFDVKLDTNGSFPDRLEKVIKDGDVDYIAMDIKSPLEKYPLVTQVESQKSKVESNSGVIPSDRRESRDIITMYSGGIDLTEKIKRSIKLIMNSGFDYEFRTTVMHPLHKLKDFEEMGKMIKGAKKYYLQNFVKTKQIAEDKEFTPFTDLELEKAKKTMEKFVKEVGIR